MPITGRVASEAIATTIIATGSNGIPLARTNSTWKFLLALLGVWVLFFGTFTLSQPPLFDGPNTLHAVAAKELIGTGGAIHRGSASVPDWLLDRSIAQSYRIFGVSDMSARLPLAIYVLIIVLVLFFLARRFFGSNASGLYAGLVILLWPGTYWDEHLFSPSWLWPLAAPIVALGVGYLLAREEVAPGKPGRRVAAALLVIGAACAVALIIFAFRARASLRGGRIEAIALRIPLLVAAAAVLIGVVANYLFRRRDKARMANCFVAGAAAGLLIAFHVSLVMLSASWSSQILSDAIRPEVTPQDIILINGKVEEASSFVFYIDRPVNVLSAVISSMPSAGNASMIQVWNGPGRVFLWTETDHEPVLPSQSYRIAQSGGKEILSNQPNSGGAEF